MNRKSRTGASRSPVQTGPRPLTGYPARSGAACSPAAAEPVCPARTHAEQAAPFPAASPLGQPPQSNCGPTGRLELSGKIIRIATCTNKADHLTAELRRIRRARLGPREHLWQKPQGVHRTGSIPGHGLDSEHHRRTNRGAQSNNKDAKPPAHCSPLARAAHLDEARRAASPLTAISHHVERPRHGS